MVQPTSELSTSLRVKLPCKVLVESWGQGGDFPEL